MGILEEEFVFESLSDKMNELQQQCPLKVPSKRRHHQQARTPDVKYKNY
jgi:hypothetical protein